MIRRHFLNLTLAFTGMNLKTKLETTLSELFYKVTSLTRPESPFELQPGQKKLGLALVGLGKYADGQLGPALKETKLVELRGVVTGDPQGKGKAWAQKYGFPEANIFDYAHFDQLAQRPDIDIIYVVLPNNMHAEYVIKAFKAGKHVITEKPMALSVAECRQMIDASQKAGKKLSVGYRLHFDPYHQEVMRLGQQKVLGALKSLEAGYAFDMKDTNQWRAKKNMAGGGPLMDVGIYAIQACRYTTGQEPIAVTALAKKSDRPGMETIEGGLEFTLEFPNNLMAKCRTSYLENFDYLHVETEQGHFHLEPAYTYNSKKGYTHQGKIDKPEVFEQAFQMDAFAHCVLNNEESNVPGSMGLQDLKIIEAIYKAAETGQRQTIE